MYTGERITEGTFDDGENFTFSEPWYPNGDYPGDDAKKQEHRALPQKWRGATLLRLKPVPEVPPEADPAVPAATATAREQENTTESVPVKLRSGRPHYIPKTLWTLMSKNIFSPPRRFLSWTWPHP